MITKEYSGREEKWMCMKWKADFVFGFICCWAAAKKIYFPKYIYSILLSENIAIDK